LPKTCFLQCAVDAGCSDAVVIASLLHDMGHLMGLRDTSFPRMGESGVVKHEILGQSFCDSLGLPPVVGQLVAGHVDAKRYLCWKNRAKNEGRHNVA
jgi:predicted HD phosphohydrolase